MQATAKDLALILEWIVECSGGRGTLLAAYPSGLFPMPLDRRRIAWFSPDPRGVLPLDGLHVSRTLRRSLRQFDVTLDTAFTEVMTACGEPNRPGGWINRTFIDAYTTLHELGWAYSVEVLDPTSGASVAPISSPIDASAGTFSYTRGNPSLSGATYTYEWSETLAANGWTTFTPTNETGDDATPVETVQVTLPAPLLGKTRLFVRVVATPATQ